MKRYIFAGEGEYYSAQDVDAVLHDMKLTLAEKDKEITRLDAGWHEANFAALEKFRASNEALAESNKSAKHWEQTCHDQWENYQNICAAKDVALVAAQARIEQLKEAIPAYSVLWNIPDNLTALSDHDAKKHVELLEIHKIGMCIAECPPVNDSDTATVRMVKEMAHRINGMSDNPSRSFGD